MAYRLALSLVLLSIAQSLLVFADYEVRVAVHSYHNPSHRHAGGGCCDLYVPFFGCGDCDNYFLFCLRTPEATQNCPLGELHSGEVGGDSLTFNPGVGGSIGRLSNPLRFTNTGNWTGSFQLVIEVNDDDDFFPATLNGDEFVDLITITRSLAVGGSFTGEEPYLGENGRGTIVLSFLVACVGNFYGPDCGILCVPQDSSGGHYTCDNQGNRVCLEGYRDPASNCTQCLPSGGCSAVGGYCREPYECFCHSGFTGEFCESVIDACGQLNPCQNGGSCEIDALGNLSCSCAPGFMGPSCEVPTDETTPTDDPIPNMPIDETTPTDDPIPNLPIDETPPTDDPIPSIPIDETTPTDDPIPNLPIDETPPTDDPIPSIPIDETTPTNQTTPTDNHTGESHPAIPPAETPGSLDPTLLPGGRSNQRSTSGPGASVLAVAVAVPLLVVLLSVAIMVTLVLVCQRRRRKWWFSGEVTTTLLDAADAHASPPHAPRENPMYIPSTMGVVSTSNSSTSTDHEFDNPLYSETPLSASYTSIHDNQFATSERPYVPDTLSSASSVDFKFDNPLYGKRNGTPLSASYVSIHDNQPTVTERPYSTIDHSQRPHSTSSALGSPLVAGGVHDSVSNRQTTPEGQYTSPYVSLPAD